MTEVNSRFGTRPAPLAPSLLAEIVSHASLVQSAGAAEAGPRWGAMHKVLLKAKVQPAVIMRLVANRDVAGLADLVRWLSGEVIEEVVAAPVPVVAAIDPEILRAAMKTFRKRLRYARLDAESRLGVGPMTSGKKSDIDALEAPRDYPTSVWHALVAAGRLKNTGGGFYALVDDDEGE